MRAIAHSWLPNIASGRTICRTLLVYRTGEYSYDRDPYAEFMVHPAEGLVAPMSSWFRDSGGFSAVIETGSAVKPDTLVEIQVVQLYGDFRPSEQPTAVLAMRFVFLDSRSGVPGKVILQQEYSRAIPLKARTAAPSSRLESGAGPDSQAQPRWTLGVSRQMLPSLEMPPNRTNMDHASDRKEYDYLVLGSGEGAKFIAWTLAKQGERVAVIERKYIGGSCPNIACLPSKNIIHSAKVASYFYRGEEFGITKDNCKINMSAVRDRKRKMVDGLIKMHLDNFKASGAELIMGFGRFVGPKTIDVALSDGGTRVVRGKKVIIGTGTRAAMDPIPGLAEAGPLTHIEALELDHIPQHIVILGGGYIGLEMAQAMRRFGSRVTVIERNERLAHREDGDVSAGLHELFRDEGIGIVTSAFRH